MRAKHFGEPGGDKPASAHRQLKPRSAGTPQVAATLFLLRMELGRITHWEQRMNLTPPDERRHFEESIMASAEQAASGGHFKGVALLSITPRPTSRINQQKYILCCRERDRGICWSAGEPWASVHRNGFKSPLSLNFLYCSHKSQTTCSQ